MESRLLLSSFSRFCFLSIIFFLLFAETYICLFLLQIILFHSCFQQKIMFVLSIKGSYLTTTNCVFMLDNILETFEQIHGFNVVNEIY